MMAGLPAGPLCLSWDRSLREPLDADWEACPHDSCWDIATGNAPVRLCCGQRHLTVACPDGLVQCCLCFARYRIESLSTDPADGMRVNICIQCAKDEEKAREKRS